MKTQTLPLIRMRTGNSGKRYEVLIKSKIKMLKDFQKYLNY